MLYTLCTALTKPIYLAQAIEACLDIQWSNIESVVMMVFLFGVPLASSFLQGELRGMKCSGLSETTLSSLHQYIIQSSSLCSCILWNWSVGKDFYSVTHLPSHFQFLVKLVAQGIQLACLIAGDKIQANLVSIAEWLAGPSPRWKPASWLYGKSSTWHIACVLKPVYIQVTAVNAFPGICKASLEISE